MSLVNEYIDFLKQNGPLGLENELQRLIGEYNKARDTHLLVYVAAIDKQIPGIELLQDDYFLIRDILAGTNENKKLDVYIETPGGQGETAEEIVRYFRDNYDTVSFVIAGEAKSAGTIIALSGDEILMTETGSLGPIDAQVPIGRSVVSAHAYVRWVDEKRLEAEKNNYLNAFDATMVAQITPGELERVVNALKFAEDRVIEWLPKYKFKNWNVTETRKEPVTEEQKTIRAEEIAKALTDHSKWQSHGRSIKIKDLADIGLKITRIDDNQELADIVYRIQTVCKIYFGSTNSIKIFATEQNKIFKNAGVTGPMAAPINMPVIIPGPSVPNMQNAEVVELVVNCPQCNEQHKLYAKFVQESPHEAELKKQGFMPFPKDAKIVCSCGYEIDLLGIKSQVEAQAGKPMVI